MVVRFHRKFVADEVPAQLRDDCVEIATDTQDESAVQKPPFSNVAA
jgi:hypothetical protein